MAAYWLARATIIDPAKYRRYNETARAAWPKYPRRVLARGGRYEVLEGAVAETRFVVQEFESFDLGLRYFHSPEYQAAATFRRDGGSISQLVLVEGVSGGDGTDVR